MSTLPEPDDHDRMRDDIRDGLRPVPAGWCRVCHRAPAIRPEPGMFTDGTCPDCYYPPDDAIPTEVHR